MSASQLVELEDFYNMEPFGEIRQELRHGQRMALDLNLNRDTKARSKPFTALECMNFVEVEEEPVIEESPEVISKRIASELFRL